MRHLLILAAFTNLVGCKSGLLDPAQWGTFRYFGELTGVPEVEWNEENNNELLLEVVPPVSDREGNIYVLYEDPNGDSVAYVGKSRGGWTQGCKAEEEELPHTDAEDSRIHGFLGTAKNRAWLWVGDALVEVNGVTGQCNQVLDADPLTVTDLKFVAAVPYVHETPARRTLVGWVQGVNDAYNRLPPYQVVVDLDLGRYVAYNEFEPTTARCVDVLGVGANQKDEEGVIVVAYNLDGERHVEGRIIDAAGNTRAIVDIDLEESDVYACEADDSLAPEPSVLGQIQANDDGIYAGILTNGKLLAFNERGGDSRDLPDFDVQGLLRLDGDLYVSGTHDDRPVVGLVGKDGQISEVLEWKTSENAARALQGKISVLDQRYQPAEPIAWRSPVTAMGSWPFISPYPLDEYALDTTGWLIAGPSFDSTMVRTAVAFGPVGIAIP